MSTLDTTQVKINEEFGDRLRKIEAGEGALPLVVSANFGDGKSHLLRCLQSQASKSGFVTSLVVVSPETPLGKGHVVLKAIAEASEAPGRTGKATRELASNAPRDAVDSLRLWAREAPICDRFRALLRVYEATNDEELRVDILGDLEGRPLIKNRIKQELRILGEASSFDLKSPRNALLAHDRLRLLAQFFKCHGKKGLVVFFDEVERIQRFSRRARLATYEELGWWCRLCQESDSRVFAVFAETAGAIEQCLEEKGDWMRLESSTSSEDGELAREGAEFFRNNVRRLEPVTREQLDTLQFTVQTLYKSAYGVDVQPVERRGDVHTTVRSEIRRWITVWDLERHYPSYTPTIESKDIAIDTADVPDEDLAQDDNDSAE